MATNENDLTENQRKYLNEIRLAGQGGETLLPNVIGAKLRDMGFAAQVKEPTIERKRGYSVWTAL